MLTMTAARRCAAGLAVALVAAMLVTFGGHPVVAGSRPTTGATHAGVWFKPGRLPQSVAPTQHTQVAPHLDLAATPPVVAPSTQVDRTSAAPSALVERPGQDAVTPTGRAPPAP